jgi:hypothetical protein
LTDTETNKTFTFYTENATFPYGSLRADHAIYYPQSDLLVVAGNGLYAIINATRNYNLTQQKYKIII